MPRALAAALILSATAAAAQEGQGYLELRTAWFPGAAGDKLQAVQELRPTFSTALGDRFKLVATVDLSLAEGRDTTTELRRALDKSGLGPLLQAAGCAWPAPANGTFRINGAPDYLSVDRLYLDHYSERLDLRVGRQALHWGSAQFFNPTDPFPEVLLAQPWKPRKGVNAARAHLAFSALTDVTAVAGLDDSLVTPRAALRARTNALGVDAALTGVWRGGSEWLAGLDLRGTALVGFWVEAALRISGSASHEELAAGVDYSFPVFEKLVLTGQYYRNGGGAGSPDQYDRLGNLGAAGPTCNGVPVLAPQAADPFAPFTLARDYLLLSASAQLTPELSASLPLLQNLDDGTAFALPTVSWALLDWLELSLAAQVPFTSWGDGGEFKPRAQDLLVTRTAGGLPLTADLRGLVPAATLTLWARASF